MKFVLLSDLHLLITNPGKRKDNLSTVVQWKKLHHVFRYARKHKCSIIQAGDFTDIPRSWFLYILIAVFLRQYPSVKVYAVFGQHDTYLYSEESRNATILGALHNSGLLTILGKKPTSVGFGEVDMYGASYGSKVPKPESTDVFNILTIHDNISDRGLYDSHKYTKAVRFIRKHRHFDLVLCGDIHKRFIYHNNGRTILNTGPLLRTTTHKHIRKHKPCFAVLDTDTNTVKFKKIPHKSSAEVLSKSSPTGQNNSSENLSEFLEKVNKYRTATSSASRPQFKKILDKLVKESKASKRVRKALSEIMEE